MSVFSLVHNWFANHRRWPLRIKYNDDALLKRSSLLHLPTILAVILISIFAGFSTFFALHLKRDGIIPDEETHIFLSQYFSTTWGIPSDSPETYSRGLIAHKPNLYYWVNGRLLNILQWIIPEPGNWKVLVTLRLTSVLYSTLAVFFCYLLAKEIIKSRWWQVLVVFLLTSTLMFVFLSGGVNYDNLVNLCCFAGVYFLTRLFTGKSFYVNSFGWMICILTGTLVKITVIPILAVMTAIWAVYTLKNRHQIDFRPAFDWKATLSLVLLSGLVLSNFMIFGVNLIKFKTVIPSCTMILTESQCEQSSIFLRDKFASEKFSVTDMFNGNVPNPVEWFNGTWAPSMVKMIYGAMGSRIYNPSDLSIKFYFLWFLWMFTLSIWSRKKVPFPVLALSVIIIFYSLTLLQTNLSNELNTGFKHLGIQGRYIFPVIGPLYVLLVYFAENVPNKIISSMTVVATLALFFLNSPLKVLTYPSPIQFPSTRMSPEEHALYIGNGTEISQDFRSECPGTITQVEILFSTGELPTGNSVNFRLINLSGHQLITEQRAVDIPRKSETWLLFPIPSLEHTQDREYRFTLNTDSGDQENTLALWNTKTNVYRGGDAIVNGVPTNYDLIFRYTCKMRPLTDWFN